MSLSRSVDIAPPRGESPGGLARPSDRVVEVAAMFGLGADQAERRCIVPPTELTLVPGQLVLVTGASGGGKSTFLRLIRDAVRARPDGRVIDFDQIAASGGYAPDATVVDTVDRGRLPLADALRVLSLAGLNDAFVMLRRPGELSDGQRYRFRLARAMAEVELGLAANNAGLTVVLADEFGATLDRTAAAAVARNVRRWVTADRPVAFVAATTHDDILEPLCPDVLIEKRPSSGLGLHLRKSEPAHAG
ncbi:MAG: ATP-binding cassette domain-containing protein [Planctomycetota bacterium]